MEKPPLWFELTPGQVARPARPAPRPAVIHTAPAPSLTLRERVDQQLDAIASPRTRDIAGIVLGLALAFFATRVHMRHWSARQIIDDEILRGSSDIKESIIANVAKRCAVKLQPDEVQLLATPEAGMRDGALEATVTIRSDSTGFYEQHARLVRLSPSRPALLGFDVQPTGANLWKIEKWREPMRIAFVVAGLALLTVCGVRLGTSNDG